MRVHLLVWDEKRFGTGVASIDIQHRELLERANRVMALVNAGHVNGVLQSALEDLILFVHTHFTHEEWLMEQYGYPETEAHVEDHLRLVRQLKSLKQNLPSAATSIKSELFLAFLVDLVELHLVGADASLAEFLLSGGSDPSLQGERGD